MVNGSKVNAICTALNESGLYDSEADDSISPISKSIQSSIYKLTSRGKNYVVKFCQHSKNNLDPSPFMREVMIQDVCSDLIGAPKVVYANEKVKEPLIIMEYLEGKDMFDLLKDEVKAPGQVLNMMEIIARKLDCIHRKGITHNDIKPENLFVEGEDIKIVDYGCAHFDHWKTPKNVMGTLEFLAPERFYNKISPMSDQYSFGILCCEMANLDNPFHNLERIAVLIRKKRSNIAIDLKSLRKEGYPEGLADIINKSLKPYPEDRYCSCNDLAEEIKQLKA